MAFLPKSRLLFFQFLTTGYRFCMFGACLDEILGPSVVSIAQDMAKTSFLHFLLYLKFSETELFQTGIERTVSTPSTISCAVWYYFLVIAAVKSKKLEIVIFQKTPFSFLASKVFVLGKNLTSDRNCII